MTYYKPLASAYTGDSELYETCVWIGCEAAKGKSNETDVVNAIWNKFQTINIITRDGRILYYYKDGIYTGLYYHTDDLLCFGDGRC